VTDPRIRQLAQPPGRAGVARLERTSSVPLYFQLAEILKERIEGGRWSAGDRFPSEREITDEFGVSRTVIRPALDLLESDGQLIRVKGRGTFVTPPKIRTRVAGLIRMLSEDRPSDLVLRILSASEQEADPEVVDVLGLVGDAPTVSHVVLVVERDGVPVAMSNSFVARERAPWLLPALEDAVLVTPDASLIPVPVPKLMPARATIATAFVSEWEAIQLGMSAKGVCFLIRYLESMDDRGVPRPVEFARVVFRADAVELGLTLA
jgi:GntR family transcriptional regulator